MFINVAGHGIQAFKSKEQNLASREIQVFCWLQANECVLHEASVLDISQ